QLCARVRVRCGIALAWRVRPYRHLSRRVGGPVPFSVDHLAQHAGVSVETLQALSSELRVDAGRFYSRHTSRKKHGGIREIFEQRPPLDAITKNLHRSFIKQLPYEVPDHVHGFVRGRSTVSNASQHLGKTCVLRVDLEDFFPSISAAMIKASLQAQGYEDK